MTSANEFSALRRWAAGLLIRRRILSWHISFALLPSRVLLLTCTAFNMILVVRKWSCTRRADMTARHSGPGPQYT